MWSALLEMLPSLMSAAKSSSSSSDSTNNQSAPISLPTNTYSSDSSSFQLPEDDNPLASSWAKASSILRNRNSDLGGGY